MAKDCQVQKGLRLLFLLWTVTLCSESQSEKYTIALPNLDTSREASETKINQHVMINTTTSEHVSKNNVQVRGTSFGLPVPIVHSSERPPDKEEKAQENHLYKSLWQTKAMVEDQLARSLNRSAGDVKSEIPCPTRCACDSNKTITVVDCSSRGLTRIPKFPASVREIHLRNNSIHIVTCTSFSDILHLTYLDISQNILKTLFACSFGTLRFLKHLISSDCQLTHLPSGIFDSLRNLQTLDLSKNNLSNIVPLIFKEMKELKSLQLHRNKLRQLRNDTFEGLTSLRSLSLHGNCLRYISNTFECEAFRGLPSLEELLIQENHPHMTDDFMYPDTALSRVPSLRRLRLDGWPRALGPGFSTLKNLTQLHMGNFGYCGMGSSIPFNFFSALSTNKPLELRMPRCGLTAIPPSLFKPLPNLYSLDLGENSHLGFDNFARGSVGLQNSSLEILNLTRIAHPNGNLHEIKNLTFRFLKNTPLRILLLEWNQLLYVSPKAMTDLPNSLEYISLYNNRLQNANFIFTILITFRNLRVFRLSRQLKYASTNPISFTTINNSLELPDTQNSETKELLPLKTYENTNPQLSNYPKPEIIDSFKFSKSNVAKMREDNTFCSDSRNVFNKKTDQISFTLLPFPIESKLEILLASDIKASYDIPEIHITNNVVLRHIDYSKNYVRCFGGPLSGVPSLAYLDLSRNWCIRMNNRFFLHMTALKTLLLYENVLGQSLADDRVGLTFSTLIHLEILDLSVNALKDLSDHAFINNRALRLLNMSHNDLIQFRPNLANNINLDRLDLTKNRLQGFSQSACLQLVDIKRSNRNFKVLIKDNDFRCNCDNLHFLKLLLNEPDIFENIHLFKCQLVNGSTLGYERLPDVLSDLMTQCVAQVIFFVVLVCFFLMLGGILVTGVYHYKRWKLKYLTLVGKTRLHIGARHITYKPAAQVFITYDQEDRGCRTLMRKVFLPGLRSAGISHVLGELDFQGGPLTESIAGAVVSTRKTLVILSQDIFQDFHRELEVNLAVMHELHVRRHVVVPVFLLPHSISRAVEMHSPVSGNIGSFLPIEPQVLRGTHPSQIQRDETPAAMLQRFPPEISAFLEGQARRCLVFDGGSTQFWNQLIAAILGDED